MAILFFLDAGKARMLHSNCHK